MFPVRPKAPSPLPLCRRTPNSSTPNCRWPHGWVLAGERDRLGCRFRRRAENRFPNYPQRRQARHICRTQNQNNFQPRRGGIFGGARLLTSWLWDTRPTKFKMMSLLTELCPLVDGDATNMPALTGLVNLCSIVFHLWLNMQPPFASFVHPKLPLAVKSTVSIESLASTMFSAIPNTPGCPRDAKFHHRPP